MERFTIHCVCPTIIPESSTGASLLPRRVLQLENRSKQSEAGHAELTEAVEALGHLVHRGSYVDRSVFYSVLRRCIAQRDLVLGSRLHTLAVCRKFESDTFLANHFICMYASHGKLEEATRVFKLVSDADRYMWASIILAHARHGEPAKAIHLYRHMRKLKVQPDNHVFVAALKACASAEDLTSGKQVHADICRSTGCTPDIFVLSSLVDMYAKCGSLQEARKLFDSLPKKNVVTWSSMIAGYAQQGRCQEALTLYASMQQERLISANHVTFVSLLQACAGAGVLHLGRQIHAEVRAKGLEMDLVLGTCLVDMYAKCGSIQDARLVFDNLHDKNVLTWNAIIAGYAQHGQGQEALSLYTYMQQTCSTAPNASTFVYTLQACGSMVALEMGRDVHAQVSTRILGASDVVVVANALIDMYGKCGSMAEALYVFDALVLKDIVSWNALIAGYARLGDCRSVFRWFALLNQENLQPDGITFLSLLNVCSHVGQVTKAYKYLETMSTDYGITPTLGHYTCMIDLLGRAGQMDKAMDLLETMPFQADGAVWRCMLAACQKWTNVELGRHAFECAIMLDKNDAAAYLMMWNIYEAAQMQADACRIQAMRLKFKAWKQPGRSWWTDTGGMVHTFVLGGSEHVECQYHTAQLTDLMLKLEEAGCASHVQVVARGRCRLDKRRHA